MEPAHERLIVLPEGEGARLDKFISEKIPALSRSLARKLIDGGLVTVDGREHGASHHLHAGEVIDVRMVIPPSLSAVPEAIDFEVVYQDESMAIINKPAGLVVHPAAGHSSGTLVNGLLARYPELGGSDTLRPGLVHRLDKDTSGLMVVALSASAQASLGGQLKSRRMRRKYTALVLGKLEPPRAVIDIPIGRDPISRKRMAAGSSAVRARNARTHYEVREVLNAFTLANVTLETGRTHQIRVHMAYIGHPVAGVQVYSHEQVFGLTRQFLHAGALELASPATGEPLSFRSALPSDLQEFLDALLDGAKSPHATASEGLTSR